MGTIDIVLGGLIAFGIIRGLIKGFFAEATALLSIIAGVYCAMHFSYFIGDYLAKRISWDEKYINMISFSATLILVIALVTLIGKLLTEFADAAMLGVINRVLGAGFGGLKIAILLGAILVFFDKTNNSIEFIGEEKLAKSKLYSPVKEIGRFVFSKVLQEDKDKQSPEEIQKEIEEKIEKHLEI